MPKLVLPGGEWADLKVQHFGVDIILEIRKPEEVNWDQVIEHVDYSRRGIVLPEHPNSWPRTEGQARADGIFMGTAFLMATRSTCTRGHVGAVAVRDRRIVATGYNGSPPGMDHCTDVGCDLSAGAEAGCQRTVHAESNLVAWAARAGVSLQGTSVYATHSPCARCAQLLLSAGIEEYHYSKPYRLGEAGMLTQQGIFVMDHGGMTYWPTTID